MWSRRLEFRKIIKINVCGLLIIHPNDHNKFRISLSTFLTDITVVRLLMHVVIRVVFSLACVRVCEYNKNQHELCESARSLECISLRRINKAS